MPLLVLIPFLSTTAPAPVVTSTAHPISFSVDAPALIRITPKPNYDEVLQRIHDDQAKRAAEEAARLEALRAQQEAEAAKEAEQQAEVAQNVSTQATENVSGSCYEWLLAAGVTDTNNAMIIINRESGCNPYAVNPSSGSCNVAQELPCGKSGCALGDGACSVAWMNRYVIDRYGSWANAVAHSLSVGWY